MPRTPQQNRRLRDDSERRLRDAAQAVFTRLGVQRATVRDIAEQAGVAQGLLYNYFASKDDLVRAVFREGARDVAAAFGAASAVGTPEARLERLIRRSFEIVRERREFWQLSYMLRHQPGTSEVLGTALTEWTDAVRGQLEGLLQESGHPDAAALARVLFGAIDGVAQHYVLDPERYPLAATVESLVQCFRDRPPASDPPDESAPPQAAKIRRPRKTRPTRREPRHPEP